MAKDEILARIISGDSVDTAMVENLGPADTHDLRRELEQYLPKKHVERILDRIDSIRTSASC